MEETTIQEAQETLTRTLEAESEPVSLIELASKEPLKSRFYGTKAKRTEPTDIGQRPKLRFVDIKELYVDPDYQRTMRMEHVLNIALNFSWEKFQALSVMRRGRTGKMIVTDGQHKAVAAFLAGIEEVPVLIYESKGLRDEASQFYGINHDRRAVPLVVKHKNAVILGRQSSIELQSVIQRAGLVLTEGRPKAPEEFNGLYALNWCVRKSADDDELVVKVIQTIRQAWPEEPVSGNVMKGLTVFMILYRQSNQYSDDALIKTLKSYSSQAEIADGIDAMKRATGVTHETLIASRLVDTFNEVNRRHGSGRLNRRPVSDLMTRKSPTPARLYEVAEKPKEETEDAGQPQEKKTRSRRKKQDRSDQPQLV